MVSATSATLTCCFNLALEETVQDIGVDELSRVES